MLLYVAEAWTLLTTDAATLRVFKRKILRKLIDLVRVGDDFRIRINSELYELLNDMNVVRLWLGHVVRMEEDGYLMRGSAKSAVFCVGRTKSRKSCHRLV